MDDPGGQRVGLARIKLTDKAIFDRVFGRFAQPISDYTFANTFIWGSSLALYWARFDRHVCVFANGAGDLTLLQPPMPEPEATDAEHAAAVRACFAVMDSYNRARGHPTASRIEYVSDEALERLSCLRDLSLAVTPFSSDYVYDTRRMIELDGGALKPKRRDRSRFERENPGHRTEPLRDEHVPACLDLLHRWQRRGDESHAGEITDQKIGSDVLRTKDTAACELALNAHHELGLRGMVLFVGEKLVGFTLGERLSPNQCSILIEKCDPDYHGAPQFIFSEFCRLYWADYPETNVGDDWGIPSLRFTKTSYRPSRLLSKYTVTAAAPTRVSFASAPAEAAPDPTPGTDTRIRPAELRDLPALVHVETSCFEHEEELISKRQMRYLILNPRSVMIVAERQGRVVGYALGLLRKVRGHGTIGRIYAVAVLPEHQGHGIGRAMVEHLLRAFDASGVRRVCLEARKDNTPALTLYRQLGFVDLRTLTDYYGLGRDGLRLVRTTSARPA